jgi:hypothetical protein
VKFLIDAQLPARLARRLNDAGHDAIHTLDLYGQNRTTDTEIARLADGINESRAAHSDGSTRSWGSSSVVISGWSEPHGRIRVSGVGGQGWTASVTRVSGQTLARLSHTTSTFESCLGSPPSW